jgi:hypothetical protein
MPNQKPHKRLARLESRDDREIRSMGRFIRSVKRVPRVVPKVEYEVGHA